MRYTSIYQVMKANEKLGHHFFEAATMEFFDSRVEDGLHGGRFFVTSEQLHADRIIDAMPMVFAMLGSNPTEEDRRRVEPREYTVRRANDSGSISTVGDTKYETAEDATVAAVLFSAEEGT